MIISFGTRPAAACSRLHSRPDTPSVASTATCPSPRCSRSSVTACHNLADGFVRPVQRRIRREQRPTVEWRAACGFFGQFRRGDGVVVGHAVAAKRRHCRFLAGAQRVRRRGDVPCRRERLRDAFGSEVVERGGDNRRRHHPERGGPSGEVAHPKSAKSQPVEGGSGLGSEVGDGVHRFEAIKEAARKRRLSAHFCS